MESQPIEFSDFSGGITENYLQSDPRRYQVADNFLITNDKKLEERPAIIAFHNTDFYPLGAAGSRINGMFSFLNDTYFFAQSSRGFYDGSASWLEVLGVGGNEVMSNANAYSQTSYVEFQRQIYLASDGSPNDNGGLPSKLYRNSLNAWTAKTAGLPRVYNSGTYTNESLLAKCISVANALRSSMISHFLNYQHSGSWTSVSGSFTYNKLHINADKYSLSYFETQAFDSSDPEVPSPIPTPAPAATDQASLFLLISALNSAYTHHISDSARSAWINAGGTIPYYHMFISYRVGVTFPTVNANGPLALLTNTLIPTDLTTTASQLDDLWQKWYWHRLAVNTHSLGNNYSQINLYTPAETKIGIVQIGNSSQPIITPNWQDLFDFANNVKSMYNAHVKNTVNANIIAPHSVPSNSTSISAFQYDISCTLPDCTDLDSFYLLTFWIRNLYSLHIFDANAKVHTGITFDTTAGSASVVNVVKTIDSTPYEMAIRSWVTPDLNGGGFVPIAGSDNPGGLGQGQVITAVAGSATFDRVFTSTTTAQNAQISGSKYHLSQDGSGAFVDSIISPEQPQDNMAIAINVLGTSKSSWIALCYDVFTAIYNHGLYVKSHNLGFVGIYYSSINTTQLRIPTTTNVSYAFYFSDDYIVEKNGIEYLIQGNPTFTVSAEAAVSYPVNYVATSLAPTVYSNYPVVTPMANVISQIPAIVNDADTNYDVANIKVNIFRTLNGGVSYFKLAEISNGTTTYSDTTNDTITSNSQTSLSQNELLYTNGGTIGYDQPPICKYIHNFNGTAYYGAIEDSGQFFPQRIRQSVQHAPDASPASFFVDLADDLTGISSTRSNLIGLCKNSIARVSGSFSSQGQGLISYDIIADTVGNLNSNGIVQTEVGVFFAGTDGFYYTDGYQVINLSGSELSKTYQSLTSGDSQKRSIFGSYDKMTKRIWWSMKAFESDAQNSIAYIFYLDYGIKPSGTFTTASNGLNFNPASWVFKKGIMYIGTQNGYILKTDTDNKEDLVPASTAMSTWKSIPIPFDFISSAVDNGTIFKRKWYTKMHLVGKNTGNMAIQPYVLRDLNQTQAGEKPMAVINYTANCLWGNPTFIWGASSFKWEYDGKMDLWRRFPRTTLRSDFMQIRLQPANIAVYSSSVNYPFGSNAVIDSTAKTATIQTPSGYTSILWPLDIVGYYLKMQSDKYVNQFLITSLDVTKKIITFSDSGNLSVNAPSGVQWEIWGIKKNQKVTITSFVLHYAFIGDKNQAYPGPYSNSGPGNAGGNPP